MTRWGTVIVAAGSGTRFGAEAPKQYALLAGRPVVAWSLEILAKTIANQGPVALVVDPAHEAQYRRILHDFPDVRAVPGGLTRQQSVQAGLSVLKNEGLSHVLIHDAARPLIQADAVARLIAAAENGTGSATLAVPVADTLMRGTETIDRAGVQAIQTPQAFRYDLIVSAHAAANDPYTDDASLVHAEKGVAPDLVPGSPDNFKITTPDDLARAEKILLAAYADMRTGIATDFHVFADGPGTMRLFGCDLPCPKRLVGHSDADAGLHAIADAILGATGAGDIGLLFPPSDPQWKDMDSARIVARALDILHSKGGILRHVDVMLMAELPRINAHRDMITARLSALLGLPAGCIGLKATTTEGMGFIGRGEGLCVQAIATVRMRA